MNPSGLWYRQEKDLWMLYLREQHIISFSRREHLLEFCNHTIEAQFGRPQWHPHWAAPGGARIAGKPQPSKA